MFFFFFGGGGVKIFNFSFFFVFNKNNNFFGGWGGLEIFVDISFGVTSKIDYFYGLFTKISYPYLSSVMKFNLMHTTTTIKHDGQGPKQEHFLGFSKISSIFGGMLEIPDIFWLTY